MDTCWGYCRVIKTHDSESWGQEEAASALFKTTQPLQWVIYIHSCSKIFKAPQKLLPDMYILIIISYVNFHSKIMFTQTDHGKSYIGVYTNKNIDT